MMKDLFTEVIPSSVDEKCRIFRKYDRFSPCQENL